MNTPPQNLDLGPYVVDTHELGRRSLENPRRPLDPWSQAFGDSDGDGPLASAGVRVNSARALTLSAWLRGLRLISNTVGKLPLDVYRLLRPGVEIDRKHDAHRLLRRRPNEAMTAFTFKQVLTGNAIDHGNGYGYIVRRASGSPMELLWLDPTRTWPIRANRKLWYIHQMKGSGEVRKLRPMDVLHIRGFGFDGMQGYPLIKKGKEVLGHAIATRAYASAFYRGGSSSRVLLKFPQKLSAEARKNIKESWSRLYEGLQGSHRTAILEEGGDAVPISISARDSQMIEVMQFSLLEIANLLDLPPHKLGAPMNISYKSLEQENAAFLDDCIDPWLISWEEECERKLLTPEQWEGESHRIGFDRKSLLMGDTETRWKGYTAGLQWGVWTPDEVREMEGGNPQPDGIGSVYYRPANLNLVGAEPDADDAEAPAAGAELLGLPDVRQEQSWDCGLAAVQAVCQFFAIDPQDRDGILAALGSTPEAGTSPAEILAFFSRVGLVTTAAGEMTVADLHRCFADGQPVLCPVRVEGRVGHWVVVIGVGLGQVFIQDPAAGRRMIAEDDWLAMWADSDAEGTPYVRYGIAVGEDLLSAATAEEESATPADSGNSEVDADDEGDDDPAGDRQAGLLGTLRRLVRSTMLRMVRRLGHEAQAAARKPAKFTDWLDEIGGHRGTIAEALREPLEAWTQAGGRGDPRMADDLASALCGGVRAGLLEVAGRSQPEQLAGAVSLWCQAVEEDPDTLGVFSEWR